MTPNVRATVTARPITLEGWCADLVAEQKRHVTAQAAARARRRVQMLALVGGSLVLLYLLPRLAVVVQVLGTDGGWLLVALASFVHLYRRA